MPKLPAIVVAAALVASTANAQSFPQGVVVRFGGKTPATRISSCQDWRAKLGAGTTNSDWVYKYRSDMPAKDEYETTEHYKQRTAREPAYASVALDVTLDEAKYNADAGTLTIDYDGKGGLVFLRTLHLGTYTGTNAFGASRRVTKTKQLTLFASFEDNQLFEPSHMVLAVSPARAKAIKEGGQIRVLGEIIKSDWGAINFSSRPTLNDPADEEMESRDVTMRPLCAAVDVGGKVLEWAKLS
ncbi:MAG: hypothetical protein ABIO85_10120 [Sphingomicrobium sp.]